MSPGRQPPRTVPVRRLRDALAATLRAVEEGGERVVLTRRGRPVAALVPVGALEALALLGRLLPDVAEVAPDQYPPRPEDLTPQERADLRPTYPEVP